MLPQAALQPRKISVSVGYIVAITTPRTPYPNDVIGTLESSPTPCGRFVSMFPVGCVYHSWRGEIHGEHDFKSRMMPFLNHGDPRTSI